MNFPNTTINNNLNILEPMQTDIPTNQQETLGTSSIRPLGSPIIYPTIDEIQTSDKWNTCLLPDAG